MTDTKRTVKQEREREKRVLAHAKAGLTLSEICDREGLDRLNTHRWLKLIKSAGLSLPVRKSRPPIGLKKENASARVRLGAKLSILRDINPQIEVSRMLGMTNAEINAAKDSNPPTHDWTLGQLQRLADASGVSIQDMLLEAFTTPKIGF